MMNRTTSVHHLLSSHTNTEYWFPSSSCCCYYWAITKQHNKTLPDTSSDVTQTNLEYDYVSRCPHPESLIGCTPENCLVSLLKALSCTMLAVAAIESRSKLNQSIRNSLSITTKIQRLAPGCHYQPKTRWKRCHVPSTTTRIDAATVFNSAWEHIKRWCIEMECLTYQTRYS